jgi:hypothetical protein
MSNVLAVKKLIKEHASTLTQHYVMGLMEIESHYEVEMVNVTEVELETDEHVWKVTVEKTKK